jgi:hypothetical protein
MTHEERERLIEAAASAHRPRDGHGVIRPHKAWLDLDASGRTLAFEVARSLRKLEAALDPEGLSTTGRAVLDRIRRAAW